MTIPSLAKRALICCFLILSFIIDASGAAGLEGSLFTPYKGPSDLGQHDVNPDIVLRQRLVLVRFDLMPAEEGQTVTLNLFEDVVVRAVCDDLQQNISNGLIWSGRTLDPPGGKVTISIVDQSLSGAVELPALTYHIRPFQAEAHVIREIRPPIRAAADLLADAAASSLEQEVLDLVNLEREIENLHPLSWNDELGAAARGHSTDMAQLNYFSHTSLDGRQFNQRVTAAGYSYSLCGENIAAGYSTPQAVMNGWMNSSGHRANILNAGFCDIGVGYAFGSASNYGHYWTQDFGRKEGVSTCPAPVVEYTITATAGLHGRIEPSGSVRVLSGANQTFRITPDQGYRILKVKIDGASIGGVGTYSFKTVTKDHSIEASFQEATKGAKPSPWLPLLLDGD